MTTNNYAVTDVVPVGWKLIRNKGLFTEVNERCSEESDFQLLSVSEYYGIGVRAEQVAENEIVSRADTLEGYKICKPNDLVMNIMLAWKSACGVSRYEGIVSPAYCVFRETGSFSINMWYYHYLFRTANYSGLFKRFSTGIIDSRLRLYPEKFLSLYSHYPPIETQKRIVGFLDKKCAEIDALIANQEQQIEKLKQYKQALITETVTKGLDPTVPMKDSGVEWIGEIPAEWSMSRLKYIASYNDDCLKDDTNPEVEINYVDIGSVSLEDGIIKIENYCFKNAPSRARRITQIGDIIVSTVRTYLKAISSINETDLIVSTGFCVIRPLETIENKFVEFFCKSNKFTDEVSRNSYGISYPAINATSLMNFWITIPPVEEQKQIVNHLLMMCSKIDCLLRKKQSKIEKLNQYKKSLIYEYVTGKKEVLA